MKYTVEEKSFRFAVRIVNMVKYLSKKHREFEIAKQILRSGTNIGAMLPKRSRRKVVQTFIIKTSKIEKSE